MADAAADKQDRADRRGDVAQAHIEDQHNAELNLGHAIVARAVFSGWKKAFSDMKEKNRAYAFLVRRGFGSEEISAAFEKLF